MRSLILFFFAVLMALAPASAQIYNPVKWSFDQEQVDANTFDLIFKAKIQDGWSIYSQYLENDDGPIRTSFNFDAGDHYQLNGKNKETSEYRKEGYDKLFDMNVIKFAKGVSFTQRVKVSDFSKPVVGYLEFMTCDATKCLPPDQIDYEFTLTPKATDANKGTGSLSPVKKEEKKAAEKIVSTPKATPKVAAAKEKKINPKEETKSAPKVAEKKASESIAEKKTTIEKSNPISATNADGILDPVHWSAEAKKINDNEFDILLHAKVADGWYIYSQFMDGDGPIPTSFIFDTEDGNVELVGKTKEEGSKKIEEYDDNFDMTLVKFKKSATFTQRVKVKDPSKMIKGDLEFMTCTSGKCLPPTVKLYQVNPSTLKTFLGSEDEMEVYLNPQSAGTTTAIAGIASPYPEASKKLDASNPVGTCSTDVVVKEGKGLWGIFILGFFGGLLALLTPCVFPMIPLTVSFFTKGSTNKSKGLRDAFLYGFFIFAVYLLLSVPFHLMDSLDPDILNNISTNIWLNLAFFAIFLFFAFSFFGYYELALPASLTNKVSSAEGVGGILGIFFMALTLALVSFSCTGPILGSLLAGALSSDGGAMQLTSGMGGFGVALALPFALFAAFPSMMNSLPRSGGWLNTVKVVLGFLELALALKFLSNADLVKHWGLLKIEPFLILWILVFLGLAAYLMGYLKFPHDSPLKKVGVVRGSLAVLSLAFAIYLASGFRYNADSESFTSLTLLSGLAPPTGYSWIYPKECPNNLNCFKDLDAGWAYAKKVNKPIMIDFTGHACVNCRKMEENVWPKQQVLKYLKDDYVLISLYVDEKIDLPEDEQITVAKKTGGKRKLRTTGSKWQHFQTEFFNNNSQPYYALLAPDGTILTQPRGYTPDADEYAAFLDCGLDTYQKLSAKELTNEKEELIGGR